MAERPESAPDGGGSAQQGAGRPEVAAGPSGARVLSTLFASITGVGIMLGLSTPLFSVVLDRMGLNASMVGLNTSVGVGATLVAAPLVPWLLKRVDAVSLMIGGIVVSAVGLVAAGFLQSAALWFLIRFMIGVGIALHWVISETWINHVAHDERRAFIAGLYSALMGLGFAVGPVILGLTGSEGVLPFALSAVLVLIAGLPLLWVRGARPAMDHQPGQTTLGVLALAPVIMFASVISGFVDTATIALLPVYGLRVGMDEYTAVLQLTVATVGAVVLQLPIGWLGDRFGRRQVLGGCAAVKTVTVAALPLVLDMPWLLWPILFLWGGAMVAFYTLALALMGSRFRGNLLAKATAALVITYCVGSVIGPLVIGGAMDWFGPGGFIAGMALISLLLTIVVAVRLRAERF
ncbi:MAG: MFS transporter [Gammaproteobacteria bacterium]|nr:MFS transporter [Gammaproteobacteria bacterium]